MILSFYIIIDNHDVKSNILYLMMTLDQKATSAVWLLPLIAEGLPEEMLKLPTGQFFNTQPGRNPNGTT